MTVGAPVGWWGGGYGPYSVCGGGAEYIGGPGK